MGNHFLWWFIEAGFDVTRSAPSAFHFVPRCLQSALLRLPKLCFGPEKWINSTLSAAVGNNYKNIIDCWVRIGFPMLNWQFKKNREKLFSDFFLRFAPSRPPPVKLSIPHRSPIVVFYKKSWKKIGFRCRETESDFRFLIYTPKKIVIKRRSFILTKL